MKELTSQEPDALESKFFDDEHRKRQLKFEVSQTEWKHQFKDGIHSRRHVFLTNEKSRYAFESKQRDRKAVFDKKESVISRFYLLNIGGSVRVGFWIAKTGECRNFVRQKQREDPLTQRRRKREERLLIP
jgi:hypothetical protein